MSTEVLTSKAGFVPVRGLGYLHTQEVESISGSNSLPLSSTPTVTKQSGEFTWRSHVPNEETRAAISDALAGKDLARFKSLGELFRDLDI